MTNKIMRGYVLIVIFFALGIIAYRFNLTNIPLIILSTALAIPFIILNIALLRNITREVTARRIFVKRMESLSVDERKILDAYIENQTWSLSFMSLFPRQCRQ